ncbi:MAG: hypothetical protein HYV54_02720 [Parcubacteria group bacterium]|nr:hypothetical protein [Parcubacteria group bacterium]
MPLLSQLDLNKTRRKTRLTVENLPNRKFWCILKEMRFAATILVLISFVGLAVFGMAFMVAPEHHSSGFNACIGSLTQGSACPENNPIETMGFHLEAFKFFSNSTLTAMVAAYLVFLLIVGLSILAAAPLKLANPALTSLARIFEVSYQPFKKERHAWYSLHENSPSFI